MTGNSASLEEIQQQAVEFIVTIMNQDPEFAKFGIMISENIGMPSNQITLLWFNNTEQLVKFLELSLPFSYCSIVEFEEIPEEISQISREIKNIKEPILNLTQIELINSFMYLASIEWVGTFNNICEAKSAPEKMLIEWFRQNGSGDLPIDESEREDFKDFLINNMYQ